MWFIKKGKNDTLGRSHNSCAHPCANPQLGVVVCICVWAGTSDRRGLCGEQTLWARCVFCGDSKRDISWSGRALTSDIAAASHVPRAPEQPWPTYSAGVQNSEKCSIFQISNFSAPRDWFQREECQPGATWVKLTSRWDLLCLFDSSDAAGCFCQADLTFFFCFQCFLSFLWNYFLFLRLPQCYNFCLEEFLKSTSSSIACWSCSCLRCNIQLECFFYSVLWTPFIKWLSLQIELFSFQHWRIQRGKHPISCNKIFLERNYSLKNCRLITKQIFLIFQTIWIDKECKPHSVIKDALCHIWLI